MYVCDVCSSVRVNTSHLLLHTAQAIALVFKQLVFGEQFIQVLNLHTSN